MISITHDGFLVLCLFCMPTLVGHQNHCVFPLLISS